MKVRASLAVRVFNEALCRAMSVALLPDDKNPPKGFRLESSCIKSTFVYNITGESDNPLLTLLSVIDEVSRLLEVIERSVKSSDVSLKERY